MDLSTEKPLFVYCFDELFQFQTNWWIAAVWRITTVFWSWCIMNKHLVCKSKRTDGQSKWIGRDCSSARAVIETFHSLLQTNWNSYINTWRPNPRPIPARANWTKLHSLPCVSPVLRHVNPDAAWGKRRKRLFRLRTSEIPVRTAVYIIKIQFTHSRTNSTKSNSSIN